MSGAANTVLVLEGVPYPLRWDKGAMFHADDIGLFDRRRPGMGLAAAAKYVWCMLPASAQLKYADPKAVAVVLPPLKDAWDVINNAIAAGADVAKNVVGSTSGHSPASS